VYGYRQGQDVSWLRGWKKKEKKEGDGRENLSRYLWSKIPRGISQRSPKQSLMYNPEQKVWGRGMKHLVESLGRRNPGKSLHGKILTERRGDSNAIAAGGKRRTTRSGNPVPAADVARTRGAHQEGLPKQGTPRIWFMAPVEFGPGGDESPTKEYLGYYFGKARPIVRGRQIVFHSRENLPL